MTTVVASPTSAPSRSPISDSLDHQLQAVLDRIPSGRRGQASAAVSTEGVEFGLGYRPRSNVQVSGYAGRLWGGKGWTAGARAAITW